MPAGRPFAVLASVAALAVTGLTLFVQSQPPPAPRQASLEEIEPIFQRLREEIAKHPRESVTHLEITSFAEQDRKHVVQRPEWGFDNDMPLSQLRHLSHDSGCAVEVAPILVLSCGCCEDTPYNVDFGDEDLEVLARLPDIRWFRIQRVQASMNNLDLLAHQPNLEVLDVRENKLTDDALSAIGELTHLKHLDLSENKVQGQGLQYLSKLTRLETLILSNNPLTDKGLRSLPRLPALKNLVLDRVPLRGASLNVLSRCPALQTLRMEGTPVTGSGLCRLPDLKHLKELVLSGSRASSVCAKRLASLPALKTLNLYQTRMSDSGLADLSAAGELKRLDLGLTRVTDNGMQHITKIPKLQSLSLYGSAVTGAGMHQLTASATLRHVDLLSMLDTPRRVTSQQLDQLLRKFRNQAQLSIVLDAESDGSSEVIIEGMPKLRSLDIQLSDDVSSITLRDLPVLQDIRIRGLGDDSWFDFESSPAPPRVKLLRFERVRNRLDNVWLTATRLETDQKIRAGRWCATVHSGESFEEYRDRIEPGYQIRVRTTDVGSPQGLSEMLAGTKPGGYFSLFCETPEWTAAWTDVLNAYQGKTFQAHIRCNRFAGPDPLNITGRIQHMHIENTVAEELTLVDAPEVMDELRLTNVGFGTLRMVGRHVTLNLNKVQRFDELHVVDLKETYSVDIFDSVSAPAYRPNTVRLTNCSQVSKIRFRNARQVKEVIIEGDAPPKRALDDMPRDIEVRYEQSETK